VEVACGALPETDRSRPASWVSGTDQGLSGGSPLVRQRQASQVRRGTDQHKFTHRAWSDDRRGSRGVGRQHSRGRRVFRSAPQAKAKLTTPRYPTAALISWLLMPAVSACLTFIINRLITSAAELAWSDTLATELNSPTTQSCIAFLLLSAFHPAQTTIRGIGIDAQPAD